MWKSAILPVFSISSFEWMSEETGFGCSVAKHIWLSSNNHCVFVLDPEHRCVPTWCNHDIFIPFKIGHLFALSPSSDLQTVFFCVLGREMATNSHSHYHINYVCSCDDSDFKGSDSATVIEYSQRLMWLKWRARGCRGRGPTLAAPTPDPFLTKPIKSSRPSASESYNHTIACFGLGLERL